MKGLLVGFGSIGRRHLTNLHALGVDDWVVVHTGKGTLPLEAPVAVRTYDDLATALAVERPTFAVVANPTNLHVPSALSCVEAGCHVLLEKPVSHELVGVDALRAAVDATGTRLLVGFQFRFHPALEHLRRALADGRFGAPLSARVVWSEHLPSWHPWEDFRTGYAARADLGGGVHHTICHPFDYLRMLFGDARVVSASFGSNPLGLDVPEAVDASLRFDGGVDALVHLDYWGRPLTHRLEVACEDGTIMWDFPAAELRAWQADDRSWTVTAVPGVDDRNELFVEEARHFLDVVAGVAVPVCSLEDGIRVVEMCAAIEDAARRGDRERVS